MADNLPLTFVEDSPTTVAFTISPATAGFADLTDVASVQFVLKADACDDDTELVLTSTDPTQILLSTHTATEITGDVEVPALAEPYPRLYHIDAVPTVGEPRTAIYGRITVVDL